MKISEDTAGICTRRKPDSPQTDKALSLWPITLHLHKLDVQPDGFPKERDDPFRSIQAMPPTGCCLCQR